ncbi:hypothetical protein AGMMS49936_09340 [Endomicrobiia bacterium]|nr:hypothetical protein AGMMS49936_09340 [Endomicrobiia bacterium]
MKITRHHFINNRSLKAICAIIFISFALCSCPQCPNPRTPYQPSPETIDKPKKDESLPPLEGSLSSCKLVDYSKANTTDQIAKLIIYTHQKVLNTNDTLNNLNKVFNKLGNNLGECKRFCSNFNIYIEGSIKTKKLLEVYSNTLMDKECCETLIDIIVMEGYGVGSDDLTRDELIIAINKIFKMAITDNNKKRVLHNFLKTARNTLSQGDDKDRGELFDFLSYFNKLDVNSKRRDLVKDPYIEPERRPWKKKKQVYRSIDPPFTTYTYYL